MSQYIFPIFKPSKNYFMNYIKQLQEENKELKEIIKSINEKTLDHLRYFNLPKFKGIENDFCHVSTDIYGKIDELKNMSNL
jgi:hypothetical protein